MEETILIFVFLDTLSLLRLNKLVNDYPQLIQKPGLTPEGTVVR